MVPTKAHISSIITESLPPLTQSTSLPAEINRLTSPDRNLLTPDDAFLQSSPPGKETARLQKELRMTSGVNGDVNRPRIRRPKDGDRSRSRRRKGAWKKLLWVKQSYPDNYTDQETFLEHLQRNPRLQPYDFWPLVADSTVIVQHVCSVAIFIVCFVGIFQERVSPGSVVGWGSIATVLGWGLWDWWVGQDEPPTPMAPVFNHDPSPLSATSSTSHLPCSTSQTGLTAKHSASASASSIPSSLSSYQLPTPPVPNYPALNCTKEFSPRTSLRLSTAKSALLIYFTLLGLSPILKSLTRSTSSDSIWAMSFFLFTINIFFFDYGTPAPPPGGINTGNKNIPASLSTNAALMASTVLASRLPSTGQVFSLTLFSIEVFGLFPIFRRYARQRSAGGHVALTSLLVIGAGGGVGMILGGSAQHNHYPWKSGLLGVMLGSLGTCLAIGGCSWWLIGLQKYKNEIHGPWDPARPVIKRRWDDY